MLARTHARMFAVIAAFAVTLSFLSSPVQARGPAIIILFAPNQTVDRIVDGDGQDIGPGVFEAEVRGYDNGLAEGKARLRLENSRYDFYFQRAELRGDDDTIYLRGRVQRTDASGQKDTFAVNATVHPHHDDGTTDSSDCLIFDLDGANATDREPFELHFEVEGSLEVRR